LARDKITVYICQQEYFCIFNKLLDSHVTCQKKFSHSGNLQGHSQELDLGGYKWVKETKQPHKKN